MCVTGEPDARKPARPVRGEADGNVITTAWMWTTRASRLLHYVSICVHKEPAEPEPATGPVIGVDLGVKTLATVSDGREIANPKALRKRLKRLQRISRWHSRKQKGSANRKKAQRRLARMHARIAHVRQDALHKTTAGLVAKNKPSDQRPAVVVIEDLNVSGMLKNRKLSRAIADVGFYEFRRQIEYKARDAGCSVLVVSRWEPSSKTCSRCGWLHPDLTLADRIFVCRECGLIIDRDLNAAQNLAALATYGRTVSYTGTDAWGQGRSGFSAMRGETALGEPGTKH